MTIVTHTIMVLLGIITALALSYVFVRIITAAIVRSILEEKKRQNQIDKEKFYATDPKTTTHDRS